MDTKLTLKLDSVVISKAKKYAKNKNISLSRLIEKQLNALVGFQENIEENFSPEVDNLIGILCQKQ